MNDNFNNDYYRDSFNRSCQNSYPQDMNFDNFDKKFDCDDRQEYSENYNMNWNHCCQKPKHDNNNCRPHNCNCNCNRCQESRKCCCFNFFRCCK